MNTFRLICFLLIMLSALLITQAIQALYKKQTTVTELPIPQNASTLPDRDANNGTELSARSSVLQYPNAVQINAMTYQSTDDPAVVTAWYKAAITRLGMQTRTFIQTNSNETVLNKLVGANAHDKVSVEISQKASENVVTITFLET